MKPLFLVIGLLFLFSLSSSVVAETSDSCGLMINDEDNLIAQSYVGEIFRQAYILSDMGPAVKVRVIKNFQPYQSLDEYVEKDLFTKCSTWKKGDLLRPDMMLFIVSMSPPTSKVLFGSRWSNFYEYQKLIELDYITPSLKQQNAGEGLVKGLQRAVKMLPKDDSFWAKNLWWLIPFGIFFLFSLLSVISNGGSTTRKPQSKTEGSGNSDIRYTMVTISSSLGNVQRHLNLLLRKESPDYLKKGWESFLELQARFRKLRSKIGETGEKIGSFEDPEALKNEANSIYKSVKDLENELSRKHDAYLKNQ